MGITANSMRQEHIDGAAALDIEYAFAELAELSKNWADIFFRARNCVFRAWEERFDKQVGSLMSCASSTQDHDACCRSSDHSSTDEVEESFAASRSIVETPSSAASGSTLAVDAGGLVSQKQQACPSRVPAGDGSSYFLTPQEQECCTKKTRKFDVLHQERRNGDFYHQAALDYLEIANSGELSALRATAMSEFLTSAQEKLRAGLETPRARASLQRPEWASYFLDLLQLYEQLHEEETIKRLVAGKEQSYNVSEQMHGASKRELSSGEAPFLTRIWRRSCEEGADPANPLNLSTQTDFSTGASVLGCFGGETNDNESPVGHSLVSSSSSSPQDAEPPLAEKAPSALIEDVAQEELCSFATFLLGNSSRNETLTRPSRGITAKEGGHIFSPSCYSLGEQEPPHQCLDGVKGPLPDRSSISSVKGMVAETTGCGAGSTTAGKTGHFLQFFPPPSPQPFHFYGTRDIEMPSSEDDVLLGGEKTVVSDCLAVACNKVKRFPCGGSMNHG